MTTGSCVGWAKALLRRAHHPTTSFFQMVGTLSLCPSYALIFEGPVERKYVASWGGRLNIPIDYDQDRLDLILTPEVIDETTFVQDGVILDRLKRAPGQSALARQRDRRGSQPSHPSAGLA
jgi:hypothetical protein